MATHQDIANISDDELLNRMISSHDDRFDEDFWSFFNEFVDPHLKSKAQIIDVGCGPGLFLRDLRQRYVGASLYGTDVTQAMIDYAEDVAYAGEKPRYELHDITTDALPFDAGQFNLLSMVAVLHVLDDPFAVCNEIRRVLADDGVFLLQDWVRSPLPEYLERMAPDVEQEQREIVRNRLIALFTVHNRYTQSDWLWLLNEAGFKVNEYHQLTSPNFCTFVCQKG